MKTSCYINSLARHDRLHLDPKVAIADATLRRRMSRVVKMGVATAMECLAGEVAADQIDGVVTASGFGCLADSEKFLRNILEQDEELLNPTPFIQSTFNTVGAQVALLCHNHSYNVTYSHRARSFESALLDAAMRLIDNESRHVLLGAFDEFTPTQHHIMERMGLWRNAQCGEGAIFMVLSHQPAAGCLGRIVELDMPLKPLSRSEFTMQYPAQYHIWSDYSEAGCFPTASAFGVAQAVERLRSGCQRVVIYSSYMGGQPSIIVVECI